MAQATQVIEYGPYKVRYDFSFRIDGTNDPDLVYDSKGGPIASVVRTSAGLFTVTLEAGCRLREITSGIGSVATTAATSPMYNVYVNPASLDAAARTFQVEVKASVVTAALTALTLTEGAPNTLDTSTIVVTQTQAATDPADNAIVSVYIVGPSSDNFIDG